MIRPASAPTAALQEPGTQSLLVSAPVEQNLHRLEWLLSRCPGYVGVVGALDALPGEHFGNSGEPMRLMMQTLAARGLLYVDPRPRSGATPLIWGRAVGAVIDQSQQRSVLN